MNSSLPQNLLSRVNRDAARIAKMLGQKQTIWQALDDFVPFAGKEADLDWPESVFMPFGLWPCFLERYFKYPDRSFDLENPQMRGMAQLLSAIAPWRATQDIVSFDPDLEAELKDMEQAGKIPSKILMRLPAWCVYVDSPITTDGDKYDGFFVQLDAKKDGMYIAFTFEASDTRQQRIPLALGDFTLEESIAKINRVTKESGEIGIDFDSGLVQALNLTTYLCAYGLQDRQDYSGPGNSWPKPVKTKKGWRIFPPDRPKTHVLGREFGETIRKESAKSSMPGHGTKRPHVRRPHWHGFWTGAHESPERRLVVKWLPPIFVGNLEREAERNKK